MTAATQFRHLDQAWNNFTDTISYHYRIGKWVIRLIFANENLAKKITCAFNHLIIQPVDSPSLTIGIWDTVSSRQKLPTLDWNLINRNGYHGSYEKPVYLHFFADIQALSALDTEQNKAFYVIKDQNELPWWVSGSPLQVILNAWLRENNMQLTHTAAVGNDQAAVLLSGKSNSGKSTTTLACLMNGLNYLGEDYCILSPEISPKVYSVYQSAKWKKQTREMFPQYDHFIVNKQTADHEKALVYYQEIFHSQIKSVLPIRAILSLSIGKQHTPVLQRNSAQQGLKKLMMSTLLQLPLYQAKTISILKEIVSQVPQYQLILGQDIKKNVEVIKAILA